MSDNKPKYTGKETMPWYHWLAAWMMIGSAIVFWIIPEKPIWFMILLIAIGLGGYLIVVKFPGEDKKVEPHD